MCVVVAREGDETLAPRLCLHGIDGALEAELPDRRQLRGCTVAPQGPLGNDAALIGHQDGVAPEEQFHGRHPVRLSHQVPGALFDGGFRTADVGQPVRAFIRETVQPASPGPEYDIHGIAGALEPAAARIAQGPRVVQVRKLEQYGLPGLAQDRDLHAIAVHEHVVGDDIAFNERVEGQRRTVEQRIETACHRSRFVGEARFMDDAVEVNPVVPGEQRERTVGRIHRFDRLYRQIREGETAADGRGARCGIHRHEDEFAVPGDERGDIGGVAGGDGEGVGASRVYPVQALYAYRGEYRCDHPQQEKEDQGERSQHAPAAEGDEPSCQGVHQAVAVSPHAAPVCCAGRRCAGLLSTSFLGLPGINCHSTPAAIHPWRPAVVRPKGRPGRQRRCARIGPGRDGSAQFFEFQFGDVYRQRDVSVLCHDFLSIL